MRRNFRKMLSAMLVLALALSLFAAAPLTAFATDGNGAAPVIPGLTRDLNDEGVKSEIAVGDAPGLIRGRSPQ